MEALELLCRDIEAVTRALEKQNKIGLYKIIVNHVFKDKKTAKIAHAHAEELMDELLAELEGMKNK